MSVTAGLSESAPRIGTVTTSQARRPDRRRTSGCGSRDATGADRDQPRTAGRVAARGEPAEHVDQHVGRPGGAFGDQADRRSCRRSPGRTIAMLGTFWPAWKLTSDDVAFGRALAEHPQVTLIGRADDGDVDGDRQHVGRRSHRRQAALAEQLDLERLAGAGDERLGAGRRGSLIPLRVSSTRCGARAWYSPPAPSATGRRARPESAT